MSSGSSELLVDSKSLGGLLVPFRGAVRPPGLMGGSLVVVLYSSCFLAWCLP